VSFVCVHVYVCVCVYFGVFVCLTLYVCVRVVFFGCSCVILKALILSLFVSLTHTCNHTHTHTHINTHTLSFSLSLNTAESHVSDNARRWVILNCIAFRAFQKFKTHFGNTRLFCRNIGLVRENKGILSRLYSRGSSEWHCTSGSFAEIRALLRKCKALLRKCRALLWIYTAPFRSCRAL